MDFKNATAYSFKIQICKSIAAQGACYLHWERASLEHA